MQLNVRPSGAGDKTAILLHGFNCDAGGFMTISEKTAGTLSTRSEGATSVRAI